MIIKEDFRTDELDINKRNNRILINNLIEIAKYN